MPATPCHFWIQISWQRKKCRPITIKPSREPATLGSPRGSTHTSPLTLVFSFVTAASKQHSDASPGPGEGVEARSPLLCVFCAPQDLLGWDGWLCSPVNESTRQGGCDPAPALWDRGSPCPLVRVQSPWCCANNPSLAVIWCGHQ